MLFRNGIFNLIGTGLKIVLNILTVPLLIRFLGVEEYGMWALTSSAVAVLNLADGGLSTATTYFVSKEVQNDRNKLCQSITMISTAILLLCLLILIVVWNGSTLIVDIFPKLEELQRVKLSKTLQLSSIVICLRITQGVFIGIEQSLEKYKLINSLNILYGLFLSIFLLLAAYRNGDIFVLMQVQVMVSGLFLLIHIFVNRPFFKKNNFKLKWSKKKGVEILKYSINTWLISINAIIFSQVDKIIVAATLGPAKVAIYSTFTTIASQINNLSATAIQPILPRIRNSNFKDIETDIISREGFLKIYKKSLQINCCICLGLSSILLLLSNEIIEKVLSLENSLEITNSFYAIIVIYSIYSITASSYYSLISLGHVKYVMIITSIFSWFSLLLILLGTLNFGLIGAILGNLVFLGINFLTLKILKICNLKISQLISWVSFPIIIFFVIALLKIIFLKNLYFMLRFCLCVAVLFLFSFWMLNERLKTKSTYNNSF